MRDSTPAPARRQSGSMTLLFGLLLLFGAGILAFSAARTGVVEQRIATNEQSSIEAQEAAQAGLEFALAWLSANVWTSGAVVPRPPDLTAASGQTFRVDLTLAAEPNAVCARSRAYALADPGVEAVASECFQQLGLFDVAPDTSMPPPLVLAGCMTTPLDPAELYLPSAASLAVETGGVTSAACLPQGGIQVTEWRDADDNRVLTPSEKGASIVYRRARFDGCPGSECAWNQVFALPLSEAKQLAVDAGQVFRSRIPCGATSAPGIYLIERAGPIDPLSISGSCVGQAHVDSHTIGTPSQPILLIVPAVSGCPSFEPGVSLYGIVYFESGSACAAHGWGGARIHGAVIWESGTSGPASGSVLVATDYGAGSALNTTFQVVTAATRLPGTWHDW